MINSITNSNNNYNINFKINQIPNELQNLRQWIVWRIERDGDKDVKRPYQAMMPSQKARVNDPNTWSSFKPAIKTVMNKQANGVGFVFTKDDPYCFIDLDHCINERGEIEPNSKRIIDMLNSYTEISQSGRGIHIIVKAKIPNGIGNRAGNFEIYDHARYCAMTFNVLDGYPNTIEERQEQVDAIYKEIFKPKPADQNPSEQSSINKLSDNEIIQKLNNAVNSDKFKRLFYDGDTSGYKTQSEADMALTSLIAFYTQDKEQIRRIIKRSKLNDKKWDRDNYANRTIQKALANITETYNHKAIGQSDKSEHKYFHNNTFIPKLLVDDLMNDYDFISVNHILYVYLDGVWRPIGDDFITKKCYERLGNEARIHRVSEVISHIKAITMTDQMMLNRHKDMINVKNGMLNWQTREILKHDKKYLSTIQIPIEYNPDADSSKIADWLESTLGDPELITLAIELFGYCMIPDTTMAKAFMLVGSGANGKSTFIKVLERFLGEENVSKIPLQELSEHKFKRADLFGKLANVFADIDAKALESTSYFKTIVSGDTIDAERKFHDHFYFEPYARLIFSANEIPRSRDKSYAYYRRWIIIPFERKFEGQNENKNLLEELSTQESLSALFNNAIEGLIRVKKKQGFTEPEKIKEALTDYIKQNDPIKAFIEEHCVFDRQAEMDRTELYNEFLRYCENEGYKEPSKIYFYQKIRTYKEIKEVRIAKGFIVKGIKVKNNE